MKKNELTAQLESTLLELNRLADQIRQSQDFSEEAELILTLRELVLEQMPYENTDRTAHTIR